MLQRLFLGRRKGTPVEKIIIRRNVRVAIKRNVRFLQNLVVLHVSFHAVVQNMLQIVSYKPNQSFLKRAVKRGDGRGESDSEWFF